MAAKVVVIGAAQLGADLETVAALLTKPELITWQLALNMSRVVHRRTGYLQSTIYHKAHEAGATAPYAGFEEERGGSHAYATRAIEDFNMERYADNVWEPLE
jgi:hypothetical protein